MNFTGWQDFSEAVAYGIARIGNAFAHEDGPVLEEY